MTLFILDRLVGDVIIEAHHSGKRVLQLGMMVEIRNRTLGIREHLAQKIDISRNNDHSSASLVSLLNMSKTVYNNEAF